MMNKICINYLTHGIDDLEDIKYSSQFINRTTFLKKNTDVFIHNDNDSLEDKDILEKIKHQNFKNLLRTPQTFPIKPSGWFCGWAIGISNHFHIFEQYDLLISSTIDVFVINESRIKEIIEEEINSDNLFTVFHHPSNPNEYHLDFFICKPKKIKNIFSEINVNNPIENPLTPEIWFYKKLTEENFKVRKINRGDNSLSHRIDDYNLLHCHHHWILESILRGNMPNNFPF